MKVSDVMKKDVITIREEASVGEALALMETHKIRHLVVVDSSGKLTGVISDRDIKFSLPTRKTLEDPKKRKFFLSAIKVSECMVPDPLTLQPDTGIKKAAELVRSCKIGCIPVVENDQLVGIITTSDLIDCLISLIDGKEAA